MSACGSFSFFPNAFRIFILNNSPLPFPEVFHVEWAF